MESQSKIKDPNVIKAKAALYAKAVEDKYQGQSQVYYIFGIPFKETYKTNVIIDNTPATPDDGPTGKLVFDDRSSKKESEKTTYERTDPNTLIFGEHTVSTTETQSSSTPGETTNEINEFTTTIGILMDGKPVSDGDFENTSQHEAGHSGGLNHPWKLSPTEKKFNPELDQNSKTADKTAIKGDIMNSHENPNKVFRASNGTILTLNQLRAMAEILRAKSKFDSGDLIPAKNSGNTSTPDKP